MRKWTTERSLQDFNIPIRVNFTIREQQFKKRLRKICIPPCTFHNACIPTLTALRLVQSHYYSPAQVPSASPVDSPPRSLCSILQIFPSLCHSDDRSLGWKLSVKVCLQWKGASLRERGPFSNQNDFCGSLASFATAPPPSPHSLISPRFASALKPPLRTVCDQTKD